jgi:hypothetical protein
MGFIPCLELSRMLFDEYIQPLMAEQIPTLRYAAATVGMCSEILGLDDEISMDHEWGPRISLFLSETDLPMYSGKLMSVFQARLPLKYKGFDMMWRKPGVDVHDTRKTQLYHVHLATVSQALKFAGGYRNLPLKDLSWLKLSEQHLLEFTSGVVYKDDLGELTSAREALNFYPDNVLRFLLMKEWESLGSDWFPIGRIGSRGDLLGLRIQAARVASRLMHTAYLVSRRYCTYKKWAGTLFKRLPIATELEPILTDLLETADWQKIEEKIGEAAAIVLRQQNTLGISAKMAFPGKKVDDGRHHIQYNFGGIANALAKYLQPPLKSLSYNEVFWLDEKRLILFNGEEAKWSLLLQK